MFSRIQLLHRGGAKSLHQIKVQRPLPNRSYFDGQLYHDSSWHRLSTLQKRLESFECRFSTSHPQRDRDAINEFFASYPNFRYDRTAPFWAEFDRLCSAAKWPPRPPKDETSEEKDHRKRHETPEIRKGHKQREAARVAFRIAVVKDFGTRFGKEEKDEVAWEKLCRTVGISPIPESLDDRRKVC